VQDEADVHATVLKRLPGDPVLGVGWMVHFVPFHRIAAPRAATAVQATVDVQDTAARPPPFDGLGVGWMCQLRPFHRSAKCLDPGRASADCHTERSRRARYAAEAAARRRVRGGLDGPALAVPPLGQGGDRVSRAIEGKADRHAPRSRRARHTGEAAARRSGGGVAWMVQSLPFHRSARVPAFDAPTATQSVSEAQDTAFRFAPGRVGMCCKRQVRPFHHRASVDATPRVGPTVPTATHASVAGQAIPFSGISRSPDRARQVLHAPAAIPPSLAQRNGGPVTVALAHRGAIRRGGAGHAVEEVGARPGRVGGRLGAPGRPVPPFAQRQERPGTVDVATDASHVESGGEVQCKLRILATVGHMNLASAASPATL